MKLIVSATWTGCPKVSGGNHVAEHVIFEGTAPQMRVAMDRPLKIWQKREFTCQRCKETTTLEPSGTYIVE